MISSGEYVDGSWELTIEITDIPGMESEPVNENVRVKGDTTIGSVMLKLVEKLPEKRIDWSDHALWWPDKQRWLHRTGRTLEQYGVQSDCRLSFTLMHKTLCVQLPDLQVVELRVDFSAKLFSVVIKICKELGIRYPEELSLLRKAEAHSNGKSKASNGLGSHDTSLNSSRGSTGSLQHTPFLRALHNSSLDNFSSLPGSPAHAGSGYASPAVLNTSGGRLVSSSSHGQLLRSPMSPATPMHASYNGNLTSGSLGSDSVDFALASSPPVPCREALPQLSRPRGHADRARINSGWLKSSLCLMEQGVAGHDTLLLRFKFYNFYDLNPKYDPVRVNQLYEQAKWSILSEELDCAEQEAVVFAALQLQIQSRMREDAVDGLDESNLSAQSAPPQDDIDAALRDLQVTLEGGDGSSTTGPPVDITNVPELANALKYIRPKRLTLKGYKRAFFILRETTLSMFRSSEESRGGQPQVRVDLNGCDVQCENNVSTGKLIIKLTVSGLDVKDKDSLQELWIRFESTELYASWLAACRMASNGRTMADATYEKEVANINNFLTLQRPVAPSPSNSRQQDVAALGDSINPEDFLPQRILKKLKHKQALSRIVDAHTNVSEQTSIEAKLNYIRAWQALPEYGITYFICSSKNEKKKKEKEELIGIAPDRVIQCDIKTGSVMHTWPLASMQEWKINWEHKEMNIKFSKETLSFRCLSANVAIINEFIGGYIFLSLRSPDKSQTLDEEQFYRLTEDRR